MLWPAKCSHLITVVICGHNLRRLAAAAAAAGENATYRETRSSESDGRSNVTDSLECPDKFRVI